MAQSHACSHCQLVYPDSALRQKKGENDEVLYFCCSGCEGVYELLRSANLTSFYDKLNVPLSPPNSAYSDNLERFDTQSFANSYIKQVQKDGKVYAKVHLIIDKIHCAACIWLNESILKSKVGIESVQINYTNNKAIIVWDKEILPLSEIIATIRSIGYDAYAYDYRNKESVEKKQAREYYIRVIVALFCTMNIMWVAIAQYSGYFLGIEAESKDILNVASFLLCSLALFYSGFVFFRSSYYGLKQGFIGMDMLVALGSSLTYIYSIYAAITRSGETYFESVSMIITFVLIGKFLEVRARKHAGDSLDKLNYLLPSSVEVRLDNNQTKLISPEEVQVNDIILLKAGERVAIDGELVSENAIFDTKAISGESTLLSCKKGQAVLSGYVNIELQVYYRATKAFSQSLLSHIIDIVSSSLAYHPRIANLANSLSQYFSRTILSIALLTFFGWIFIGEVGMERALMIAISVIIIACPCALALATPIASVVGIGESYRFSVLFKQASFLETLAKATLVVFDKTGTLTLGKPIVQECLLNNAFDRALLHRFVSLSLHPVCAGIKAFLESAASSIAPCNYNLAQFTQYDASGISAVAESIAPESSADSNKADSKLELFGGNLAFLAKHGFDIPPLNLGNAMVFAYGIKDKSGAHLCEVFSLKDSLKPHAKELVKDLQDRGIEVAMLSGDRKESVAEISHTLGIDNALSALNPLQKLEWIESYRQSHANSVIIMIGDGINDAPALSKADIAISMGAGSDIAILSSDVVILDDSLKTLHNAFYIAKSTFKSIKQNIALSIIYNALTIPLAIAGLIIPLFAALSMSLSSIIVVLNSMRLKSFRGIA